MAVLKRYSSDETFFLFLQKNHLKDIIKKSRGMMPSVNKNFHHLSSDNKTLGQYHMNVDSRSSRCIDIDATIRKWFVLLLG